MKKSTIVILVFLALIFAELCILFYNKKHPQPDNYALDQQEYVVSERQVVVQSFPFEQEVGERADQYFAVLEKEMEDDVMRSLANYDYPKQSQNKKSAEPTKAKQVEPVAQPKQAQVATSSATTSSKASNTKAETKTATASSSETKDAPVQNSMPAWISEKVSGEPKIAIVLDDIGLSDPFVKQIAAFQKPLTASFLTYGAANSKQVRLLKESGMEVMLHIPMMPHVPANLAPITLSPEMDKAEIQHELNAMVKRFDGVKLTGANNHMGSLFTEKKKPMGYVMEFLKKNQMFFLDSKTTARSVCKEVAAEYGVPYIARDVFLDNKNDYNYIMGQLRQTERVAQKRGYAVAIGHPYSQTYKALNDWLKSVESRGFKLVRISDLIGQ